MKASEIFLQSTPSTRRPEPVSWGEDNFRNPSSSLSERFNCSLTPWVRDVIACGVDVYTRICTFIKPVQSGGSSAGELLLLYWIMFNHGLLQYNWSKNGRALDRWKSRVKRLLESSPPVAEKLSNLGRWDAVNCEVDFGNVLFRMQGTYEGDNLDSDTIPLQINEEVHAWEPGKLQKARNRSTAVWNYKSIDISNAGDKGDQLDEAFQSGTAQHWEVKCPGCGRFHVMRTRWSDTQPELGGLRYDANGCRRPNGSYDYGKLLPTIRYQFPCGFEMPDDVSARRKLSLTGRYGEPTNPGSPKDAAGNYAHRSFTLEAVSVDYIPWVQLIQQKHVALRAWKLGDMKPFQVYCRERECKFVDPMDRPLAKPLEVVKETKKDRSGMISRAARLAQIDFQEGEGRELPHWWLSIYDVDAKANVLLVFEGKCEDDIDVIDALKRHEVNPICVVVDSSYKAKQRIYDFCLRHGFNALKVDGKERGSSRREYVHKAGDFEGCAMAWSEPEELWLIAGKDMPSGAAIEPEFFHVSDQGAQDLLNEIRSSTTSRFEIPADASEEYKAHFSAWSLDKHIVPMTNQEIPMWKKATEKAPDHLYKCATYLAVQIQMLRLTPSLVLSPKQINAPK